MPSLFFPNSDAVRLAVSTGVIAPDLAAQPVLAGTDAAGAVWVQPLADLTSAPRLARLNVRLFTAPPELQFHEHPCWAALVPLRPDPTPLTGPLLFELPAAELPAFAAIVDRLRPQPLRFMLNDNRAYVRLESAPLYVMLSAADRGHGVYREKVRNTWVRVGWQHPLPGPVGFDPSRLLLVDPPANWRGLPTVPFAGTSSSHELKPTSTGSPDAAVRAVFRVALKVRKARAAEQPDVLWLLPGGWGELQRFVADADEQLTQQLDAARIVSDGQERVILRPAPGVRVAPVVPASAHPFCAIPGRKDVFVSRGCTLSPQPRPTALGLTLGLSAGQIALVESDPAGAAVHRVPLSAFRSLPSFVAHSAPPKDVFTAPPSTPVFALPGFVAESTAAKVVEPSQPVSPVRPPPRAPRGGSWIGRLAGLFRSKKESDSTTESVAAKSPIPLDLPSQPPPKRTRRPPNDWVIRRSALERQVVEAGHRLDPRSRGDLWAELAALYDEMNQPQDAAVCWANAIWDRPAPPADWLDAWVRAERKAARLGPETPSPEAVLDRPATSATARVVAAMMVRAARTASSPFPWSAATDLLLQHEHDLPARAVWLAWQGAATAAAGDTLALARCRDRLFSRLAVGGTTLDLDAPTFLRFHGTAGGERATQARDWLSRNRGLVRKWLTRTDPGAALASYGLEADFTATAAYADLLFAWALSRLGERGPARDLLATAQSQLLAEPAPGVNLDVHRRLLARFQRVSQAADHGRPAAPRPPEPSLNDPLAEYAVELLPYHSRILEPAGVTRRYLGQDLSGLVGGDGFGERLLQLFARPDPNPLLRALLAEANTSPDGNRLPRVALAGFDLAPRLTPSLAAELLARVPAALDWVPKLALLEKEGKRRDFEIRLQARLLRGATATAVRFQLAEPLREAVQHLLLSLNSLDTTVREAFTRVAAPVFAGLKKLGLVAEADVLLRQASARRAGTAAERLAYAVGWAVVGRESVAVRILDETRERLFQIGIPNVHERTATAIAYATALGFVEPRLALPRLEELFQRLDRVAVEGAAARYFAAKPLELIDAAITSVVTDEFAPGPAIRGWLDDDEFQLRKRITRQLAEATASLQATPPRPG